MVITSTVPEDPAKPGYDVLGGNLVKRPHYIHEILARATEPMTLAEIGRQAKRLADAGGYKYKTKDQKNTFSPQVTGNHLRQYLRSENYAEQVAGGRWQLTSHARQRIAAFEEQGSADSMTTASTFVSTTPDVRTVDAKSRVLLPKEFANSTVTIEMVSATELRIQKAVVLPETALPLMEDRLMPLSDRDRDLFLDLLDNPPEPTPAFRAAAQKYNKRHG